MVADKGPGRLTWRDVLRMKNHSCLLLLASGLLAASSISAQPAANGDWPMFLHDLAGTRYSPLTQIDTSNVSTLKQAWLYRFNRPGKKIVGNSPSELYQEVTPIVVKGVMYLPAGDRVVALDPETGKEIWTHEVQGIASFRGVTYWAGDRNNPPRIIFTTGRKMFGLNANTGKIDPGFGNEGEVPLEVAYDGAPIVYKNLLLLGTNFYGPGERHVNPALDQASGQLGDVHGYDVRTGKQLWTFHTIPHKGEPGIETWLKPGSQEHRTGNNVWAFALTVDEQHGLLYLPVSGPGANFYGGDRPGNNLFGNALVAVDAQTGKLKWYFQTVHHELWDYNLPPAPSLIDIKKDGKTIPALVQVGKSGYMYILNRLTGKPVFGVEEKPVAKGDVPGEWYAPTQPIPVKPPPISRVSFNKDTDMVRPEDTTPEHAKACEDLWNRFGGFFNGGPFTPFLVHEDGKPSHPSLVFPGFTGGANWGGTAIDPKLGYIFVNTKDAPAVGWMIKNPKYTPGNTEGIEPYIRSGPRGVGGFSVVMRDANGHVIGNWPCFRPPWGRLIAVNASTGDFAWQVPLGVTDSLPEGKQKTGVTNTAGPIATAGGLVFIGSTSDNRFRAFDSKTGKELWVTKLDHTATANPMTYLGKNGKQYVAIVAAGAGKGDDQGLVVFDLP
jgi:quinoprotein glucose dehydrogenase